MTKHNLKSNLIWLLQQSQCLPLPLEYCVVTPDEASSQHIDFTPEEKAENIFVEAPARPPSPVSNEVDGDEAEYMARLQLAPQTASKAALLTQQKTPNPFPTPAASRSTAGPSHSRHDPPQRPPLVSTQTHVPRTPTTTYDDSVFDGIGSDVVDIDELELAGGDYTATSLNSFGSPQTLWTEDAASRITPSPSKKIGKRKSDEYQKDIASPQQVQRAAKRPLYAFPQHEASPAAEYGSQQTVKARPPTKLAGYREPPGTSRRPARPEESIKFDEELRITETTIRTETRRSLSSAQLQRPQLHDIVPPRQYSTQPEPSPKRTVDDGNRGKAIKRVVQDSEDEDEDSKIQVKHETSPLRNMSYPPDHADDEDVKIASSSPLKAPICSQRVKPGSQNIGRSLPDSLDKARPLSASEKLSPFKLAKVESQPSQSSPAIPLARLTDAEKAYVKRFMDVDPFLVNIFIENLQKKKAEATRKMMMDMDEEDDDVSTVENQKKVTLVASRIAAVEKLKIASNSYTGQLAYREDVKQRMQALLEAGQILDPFDPDKELTKLYKILKDTKPKVDAEERAIFQLLQTTGLDDDNQLINNSNAKVSDRSVQVGSTQAFPAMPLQRRNQVYTQNKDELPSQRVTQTPVTSRSQPPEMASRPADFCAESPAQYRDTRLAASNNIPQRSPLRHIKSQGQAKDFSSLRIERPHFTRTMGSPPPDFSIADDFDMDDADMLDAAEAFEQDWQAVGPSNTVSGDSRHVLAEMSDNVRRDAPDMDMYAPSVSKIALKQYRWSKEVKEIMKKRFHLKGFRHNQLEAINATLDGKDAFVLMPTGGGKSLCYQLPSIVRSGKTQGVTIVISPLISLMQDQVAHLQKLKIQAFLVNSECTTEHRRNVFQALSDHKVEDFIQLLYVTPEMLSKSQAMISKFQDLHRRSKLARIVIDEAHCVSQWGHDFRPDYKALGEWRKQFSGVPVMALTATATENVKYDVIHNLGMDGCDIFTQSFNRPNLTYTIIPKSKGNKVVEDIASTIKTLYKGQSGIIYCLSRASCEKIAAKLEEDHGILAKHYHAGMESQERAEVQKLWQAGTYHVIVATIAFGMGIDKPDVRYVIHHSIPKSLEGYYQETGRAGRDGKRSGCYLYYGYGDTSSLKRMINDGDGSYEQKQRQKAMLRQVVQFCENQSDCRRVQILGYFNERFRREDCKESCDNCQSDSTFETRDFTQYARAAIQLVRKVHRDQVTLIHCADVLAGRKVKKAADLGHDKLEDFGLASDIERGDVERIFQRLLSEDVLEEYNIMKGGFPTAYIMLGPNYKDFESGRRPLKIQVRVKSPKGKAKEKAPDKKKKGAEAFPVSTNISSPIQARSRGKVTRSKQPDEQDADEDSDLDYFEDVRVYGIPRKSNARELGPPITMDQKMAKLNPIHRHIVEDFVDAAKKALKGIMFSKSLKRQPVTDTQLREMAIVFPQTKEDLLLIDGIDDDKANRYGVRLLKLVTDAHNNYEAMMRAHEDKPDDPNHKNVVEISSDEDDDFIDDGDDFDMSQSEVDFEDTETSQYFSAPDNDVERFNARMSQTPMLQEGSKKTESKQPTRRSRASSSSSFRGGWSHGRGRGGFSSRGRGQGKRSGAGVAKKQKPSRQRKSNDSSTSGPFSKSARGSLPARSNRGGGGGISMMPT